MGEMAAATWILRLAVSRLRLCRAALRREVSSAARLCSERPLEFGGAPAVGGVDE